MSELTAESQQIAEANGNGKELQQTPTSLESIVLPVVEPDAFNSRPLNRHYAVVLYNELQERFVSKTYKEIPLIQYKRIGSIWVRTRESPEYLGMHGPTNEGGYYLEFYTSHNGAKLPPIVLEPTRNPYIGFLQKRNARANDDFGGFYVSQENSKDSFVTDILVFVKQIE